MKTLARAALMALMALTLVMGAALAQGGQGMNEGAKATAELKNAAGKVVGAATFTQQANGVRVQVTVNDVDPGRKGIHTGSFDFLNTGVTFNTGVPASLFDADGSALIIHAAEDDEKTDPTGNSGGRVACGVVQLSQQAAAPATMPPTGGETPNWPIIIIVGGALITLGGALRLRRRV